jgi:hypothetical protein
VRKWKSWKINRKRPGIAPLLLLQPFAMDDLQAMNRANMINVRKIAKKMRYNGKSCEKRKLHCSLTHKRKGPLLAVKHQQNSI